MTKKRVLFHDIEVEVDEVTRPLEGIQFWPENARTILEFEILEKKAEKPIGSIPVEEIVEYLSSQRNLKLSRLANSIRKNGVRVPLIIDYRNRLLDGNRRFFACHFLKNNYPDDAEVHRILDNIPVYLVSKEELDRHEGLDRKIIAEANFVDDFKVPWPLDVKARVLSEYIEQLEGQGHDRDDAYRIAASVYGLAGREIREYREVIDLVREFHDSAPEGEELDYQELVREQFVYFWEFRNKALHGRRAVDPSKLDDVKSLFFKMVRLQRIKKLKQIEAIIWAVEEKYIWDELVRTAGTTVEQVEADYYERKAKRSVADKIRNFLRWIERADQGEFDKPAVNWLVKLNQKIEKILGD